MYIIYMCTHTIHMIYVCIYIYRIHDIYVYTYIEYVQINIPITEKNTTNIMLGKGQFKSQGTKIY